MLMRAPGDKSRAAAASQPSTCLQLHECAGDAAGRHHGELQHRRNARDAAGSGENRFKELDQGSFAAAGIRRLRAASADSTPLLSSPPLCKEAAPAARDIHDRKAPGSLPARRARPQAHHARSNTGVAEGYGGGERHAAAVRS